MYEWRASLNRRIAMQGQQAKMVRPTQERAMLGYLATTRALARNRVLCLFSMKAGLRAKAMASLIWAMVTDATGQGRGRRCSMDPTAPGRGRPAAAPFRCTPTSRPRWARCRGFSLRRRACTRWCISAPIWGPLPKPESASILPRRGTGRANATIPMETFVGVRLIEITKVGVDFRV
jgi:hypothetical protein